MKTLLSGDAEAIRREILKVDLTDQSGSVIDNQYRNYFLANPGREHFMLVASIAALFPKQKVFDVGTHYGLTSLAMSMCPDVTVVSYDIQDQKRLSKLPSNVEYKYGTFWEDPEFLTAPFIFMDAEPHDGKHEQEFHDIFLKNNYRGIVLWDDVFSNPQVQGWWDKLDYKRWDLTNAGHWSGTGMIVYE